MLLTDFNALYDEFHGTGNCVVFVRTRNCFYCRLFNCFESAYNFSYRMAAKFQLEIFYLYSFSSLEFTSFSWSFKSNKVNIE